ncbi:hypothetical protein ACRALDRAFT_1058816 [Sodiomyces alcalophilus JCM 7366]|uniref:uncharacterized protein n=1 Tax=Sodiomyces alcalophilus JCM 7366 TaxID=591952 RepID=UPI0039B42110
MDHFRKLLPEDLLLARPEIQKLHVVSDTFARTMKMLRNLSASNTILACLVLPILLYILIRRTGMFIFEGRKVSGPAWQFPNGQIIDKFANGRAKSDEWRKKYGAVYRVWGGLSPEIVITTPDHLRTFSLDGDKHGKHSNLGWFLDQLLGHCIGFLQGDEWKKKRQVFYPAFSHDGTTSRADSTEIAARKFVHDLPSTQSDGAATKQGEPFSFRIVQGFRQFPLFVTANVIYGPMSDTEKDELWALAGKRLALWPYAVIGGPYRFSWGGLFDRKTYHLLEDYTTEWREYNDRMVKSRRAIGLRTPLVLFYESYEAGDITLGNLMHSLDEIILTNLDVMVHAITWVITLIADNKHVQQELHEEVDANWDNLQEYLSRSDTHLHRAFLETIRLQPPAIFNIGESSPSVKNLDGVLVKPGTMVLVDVLSINVRNPFWGDDSEDFRPSRFKNIKATDLRYNLAIFGFGSRKCPGQYVAAQGVKALLVHILRQYDIEVIKERTDGKSHDTDKAQVIPMADVIVRLTNRSNGR